MAAIIIISPGKSEGEQDYREGARQFGPEIPPDRNVGQEDQFERGLQQEDERSQQLEERHQGRLMGMPQLQRTRFRSMSR